MDGSCGCASGTGSVQDQRRLGPGSGGRSAGRAQADHERPLAGWPGCYGRAAGNPRAKAAPSTTTYRVSIQVIPAAATHHQLAARYGLQRWWYLRAVCQGSAEPRRLTERNLGIGVDENQVHGSGSGRSWFVEPIIF